MTLKPSPRRRRGVVLELPTLRSAATTDVTRARLDVALRSCPPSERTMLALRLVERLSPAEAAATLGVGLREFERAYDTLLANLRRLLDGSAVSTESDDGEAPAVLRKAS